MAALSAIGLDGTYDRVRSHRDLFVGLSFDGDGLRGATWLRGFGEEGGFEVNGVSYEVRKEGFLSGTWEMKRAGTTVAVAKKRNPLTRTFDIDWNGQSRELRAIGLGRTMALGGNLSIRPVHPMTRRVVIEGSVDDPGLMGLAFWLTVLMWKRQAGASGGAG